LSLNSVFVSRLCTLLSFTSICSSLYYIPHASVGVDRVPVERRSDIRVERNALFPLVTGSLCSPSASCEIVSITELLGFLQLDDECVARTVELFEEDASGIDGVFGERNET